MKNKLLLSLAMLAAALDARAHRQTNSLALANGRGEPTPPEATKPGEDPLHPGQQAPQVPTSTLAEENHRLRAENAALKADKDAATAEEKLIRQKMAAGLTRPQAVKVVANAKRFAQANQPLIEADKKKRAEAEARAKRK